MPKLIEHILPIFFFWFTGVVENFTIANTNKINTSTNRAFSNVVSELRVFGRQFNCFIRESFQLSLLMLTMN